MFTRLLITKNLFILFSIFLISANFARAEAIHVFLIAGQSNACGHGQASELPANLQAPQTDVLYYYRITEMSGIETTTEPKALFARKGFGPEVTFGRSMADFYKPSGDKVAILEFALGGTNLYSDWNSSGVAENGKPNLYAHLKTFVAKGMDELKKANPGANVTIDGMLWVQGENDAKKSDRPGGVDYSAQYEANLNAFIKDVRKTYGEKLPFVLSRLSSGQTAVGDHLNELRASQEKVAAADPLTKMVDTDSFPLNSDNLHFSAAGQQALGIAFAKAMQSLVAPPKPSKN